MLRLSASIELEVFMDVPIFIRTYYRPANMDDSFRYGIIFRMYDLAVQLQWGNVMKLLPRALAPSDKGRFRYSHRY
ncbi:unnamed protein product [Cochlearia groenlandica]